MAKRRGITAEELMRQLEADPKWVAGKAAREARRAAREAQFRAEEAPIVADLTAAGVATESVDDLVGKRATPPEAISILVRHLGMPYSPPLREAMIRAIGVPWARAIAFEMLCASFREERDENLRFAIANALSGMARFDEVRELPGIQAHEALFAEHGSAGDDGDSTDESK